MPGVPHQAIVADGPVLPGPGRYYGGLLLATSGGAATVAVYDGVSATQGELIDYFTAVASARDPRSLSYPLHVERGLFVDLGSSVSAFTVFFLSDAEAAVDPPADEPMRYTYG